MVSGIAYIFMGLQLAIGVATTIAIKAQSEAFTTYGYFVHPFFQCFFMFLAEFICLPIFHIKNLIKRYKKKASQPIQDAHELSQHSEHPSKRKKVQLYLYLSPAGADFIASVFYFYATYFTAASVLQMMNGVVLCATCLYSKIFLRRKFFRHHYTGIGLTVTGVIIIAVSNILLSHDKKGSKETPTLTLGVIFTIISYLITPIQFVTEERIFSMYDKLDPLQGVGYEGSIGLFYILFLLPIIQFIPASKFRVDNRGHDLNLFGKVEDSIVALAQIGSNTNLLLITLGMIVCLLGINFTMQAVTKYASATSRATIQSLRSLGIWIISLILGWEDFIWIQILGFLLLTFGVILYNEVIVFPFWGFNKFVQEKEKTETINTNTQEDNGQLNDENQLLRYEDNSSSLIE